MKTEKLVTSIWDMVWRKFEKAFPESEEIIFTTEHEGNLKKYICVDENTNERVEIKFDPTGVCKRVVFIHCKP